MSKNIQYAGIAKWRAVDENAPNFKASKWKLVAAFKRVNDDGSEDLVIGSPATGLSEDALNNPRSALAFCHVPKDEARAGLEAIKQTQQDIMTENISLNTIPAWENLKSENLSSLHRPKKTR